MFMFYLQTKTHFRLQKNICKHAPALTNTKNVMILFTLTFGKNTSSKAAWHCITGSTITLYNDISPKIFNNNLYIKILINHI